MAIEKKFTFNIKPRKKFKNRRDNQLLVLEQDNVVYVSPIIFNSTKYLKKSLQENEDSIIQELVRIPTNYEFMREINVCIEAIKEELAIRRQEGFVI